MDRIVLSGRRPDGSSGLMRALVFAAITIASAGVAAAQTIVPCPPQHIRIVRSRGGVIDYLGSVPGVPQLCHMRRADGEGNFYFGVWRADWPGAGEAFPALRAALYGPVGTRTNFVTRSWPGLQWNDSFINEGVEVLVVGGVPHRTMRMAHERDGIEGNTYHSIITFWRDIETGATLKTVEQQISGKSYGPDTTWHAVRIESLP